MMPMRLCNKIYTITEYGGFTCGVKAPGYEKLPEHTFTALEKFVLSNISEDENTITELLSIGSRRGVGKILTARNYVGLITMTDGTVIEILPKIAGNDVSNNEAKKILLEMLKTLNDVQFKDFNVSSLQTDRLNLLEIFIQMFLGEINILIKQGMKSAYTNVEANESFYKGKLMASQNIRRNLVRRDRFFVQYDDFNPNRPENRLIKSTLRLIHEVTTDEKNRQMIMRLISLFDDIDFSTNVTADFDKCSSDRSMSHYNKALSWCRLFLMGNSFTSYSGCEVAIALLFPMERIFENYIATRLRRHVTRDMKIRTQDSRYSLFDSPKRAFMLRPDIVIEANGRSFVLDTKWKLLSSSSRNNGISQADMYQMYAYAKKYNAERVLLVYPYSDGINKHDIRYLSDDDVKVEVHFIDLRNPDVNLSDLVHEKLRLSVYS